MISEEKFKELEYKHGCGYWNVCWEHACPCAITTENKGYSKDIWDSLSQEAKEASEEFWDDYDHDEDYYGLNDEEYINDDDNYMDDDFDCDMVEGGCGMCPRETYIMAENPELLGGSDDVT